MSNFDPNAILRGAQLTVVGGSQPKNPISALKAERDTSIPRSAKPWPLQI